MHDSNHRDSSEIIIFTYMNILILLRNYVFGRFSRLTVLTFYFFEIIGRGIRRGS